MNIEDFLDGTLDDFIKYSKQKKKKDTKVVFKGETFGEKLKSSKLVKDFSKFFKDGFIAEVEYNFLKNYHKNGESIILAGKMKEIIKSLKKKVKDKDFKKTIEKKYSLLTKKKGEWVNSLVEKFKKKSEFEFTKDQVDATDKILNFMYDEKKSSFGMFGFAGTGKTTLTTELVSFLLSNRYVNSVALTAPTNKAVNIMKAKFRKVLNNVEKKFLSSKERKESKKETFQDRIDNLEDKKIRIDFLTIHQLLNFRNEYSTGGERIFVKKEGNRMNTYDLIIVDECSMIPFQIAAYIFEDIRTFKRKNHEYEKTPKILLVGDPAQLPPVKEKNSIIFANSKDDIDDEKMEIFIAENSSGLGNYSVDREKSINKEIRRRIRLLTSDIIDLETTVLKEVVRSGLTNIVNLCNSVRKWVTGELEVPIVKPYVGTGVKLYTCKERKKWINSFIKNIKKTDKTGKVILTWTNKKCNEYNDFSRHKLFKKEKLERFEIGDTLMLGDFYDIPEDKISIDKRIQFYTSEQIKVMDVDQVTFSSGTLGEVLPEKARKMKGNMALAHKYREVINIINKKCKAKYECWKLYVQRATAAKNKIPKNFKIYVIKEDNKDKLNKDVKFSRKKILELRKFYATTYSSRIDTIDKNIIKPLWKKWHSIFVRPFANVNYGLAISTHKAQGSTFQIVYVDLDDIYKNRNLEELKRCIYTALTRASDELHILA